MIQMKVMELVVLRVILHELRVPKGRAKIEQAARNHILCHPPIQQSEFPPVLTTTGQMTPIVQVKNAMIDVFSAMLQEDASVWTASILDLADVNRVSRAARRVRTGLR